MRARYYPVLLAGAILLHARVDAGTVNWGTAGSTLFERDGSTPVEGDADKTVAAFAMLLFVDTDGFNGLWNDGGDGTSVGNDIVVDTQWIGNDLLFYPDGKLYGVWNNTNTYVSGDNFAIVYFEDPADDFDATKIPSSWPLRYGYVDGFKLANDFGGMTIESFDIVVDQQVIPEPSSSVLFVVGSVLVGLLRLRIMKPERG